MMRNLAVMALLGLATASDPTEDYDTPWKNQEELQQAVADLEAQTAVFVAATEAKTAAAETLADAQVAEPSFGIKTST